MRIYDHIVAFDCRTPTHNGRINGGRPIVGYDLGVAIGRQVGGCVATWAQNIESWADAAASAGDVGMSAVFRAAHTDQTRRAVRRALRFMYDYHLQVGDVQGQGACLRALDVLRHATPEQVSYFLAQEVFNVG
jgi:hypothetical protein